MENLTSLGTSKTRTGVPTQRSYLKVPTDFVTRTINPRFLIVEQQIKSQKNAELPLVV